MIEHRYNQMIYAKGTSSRVRGEGDQIGIGSSLLMKQRKTLSFCDQHLDILAIMKQRYD